MSFYNRILFICCLTCAFMLGFSIYHLLFLLGVL
jgi:hypothetical protein|nr:MAG TPA: hypothetical protein [Inoviridae sp.]